MKISIFNYTKLDTRYVNTDGDTMTGTNSTTFFQIQQADTTPVFNVDTVSGDVSILGDVSASNLNTANWDTAYTHSQLVAGNPHNVLGSQLGDDIFVLNAGDTMTGALVIDGSADVVQHTIQANATQTANILEIQKSDGTVLSGVDERGILFSDGGTGPGNLFVGEGAGNILASGGDSNLAFGLNTMNEITSGTRNVAVGGGALSSLTEGSYNMGIGRASLLRLEKGNYNVGIGEISLSFVVNANANVGIGHQSGKNTTGAQGTYIGYRSGELTTSGGFNVYIGAYAGFRQTTASNTLIIDNQIRADVATEQTNSILYGVMAATPAAQTLRINAHLQVSGAIQSSVATITASADNTDVSGINTLWITTAGGAVVLGGLTGGIDGQVLYIVRKDTTNGLTLENAEGAGDQDFIMHQGTDEIIDGGGVVLICDGSDWYDVSHAKHV